MKKYLLLISCSLIAAGVAMALTAEEQLSNTKDMFINEFQKMDTDKDGQISRDEYLSYQFETFRSNVITADSFDTPKAVVTEEESVVEEKPVEEKVKTEEDIVLGGTPSALQAMADFKLEDFDVEEDELLKEGDDEDDEDNVANTKPVVTLTKEDVMPEDLSQLEEDLGIDVAEEVAPKEEETEEKTEETVSEEEFSEPLSEEIKKVTPTDNNPVRIEEMITSIRQTLPKKIDEITAWTDIRYAENVISYIYTADIDITEYSPGAYEELAENIQKEACVKAGQDMCPKIKPMFIDQGINMKIKYLDKNNEQIGECSFDKTTCQ